MYPDAYEVGCPTRACRSSTRCSTSAPDALAERTYAVWPDLEALMREHGIGQFTVDAHRPVAAFDLLGVSLRDRARLHEPADRARPRRHPAARPRPRRPNRSCIAGGHAAFNPEPIADFIDAAVLGDGEQVVGAITDVVRDWIAEGRPGGRDEVLLRLAAHRRRLRAALLRRQLPARRPHRGRPPEPRRRARAGHQAHRHEPRRVAVPEDAAGARSPSRCTSGCRSRSSAAAPAGCRFCQAGMITRPVRERSIDTIGSMVEQGLRATGFEEVGLLSLSSADHSEIGEMAKQLADRYEDGQGQPVAAVHPRRRVQHRPGQRVLAQRPALGADLRARRAARSGCAG